MSKLILQGKAIQKWYQKRLVLDMPEFSLVAGKINLLLGANGSGKTTLLRILSLVDLEYQGQLFYRGRSISKQENELLPLRRKFAVIWQNPYLYRGTVWENIGLPLKLRQEGEQVRRERVEELARKLKISHLLNKNSQALSAGEKQKVSIARALITRPEILFVDEPTTNLDYESNQFFNQYLRGLAEGGMTILLITHDLYQIEYLGDVKNVLQDGKKICEGG